MLSPNFTKFQGLSPELQKTYIMCKFQPLHKHSIGIFEAQKINVAKHNEAHKNLPYPYKKKI